MSDWVRFTHAPWSAPAGQCREFSVALAAERAAGRHFFGREVEPLGPGRVLARDPRTGRQREAIMLGSNSYLGLSTHPKVVAASRAAAEQYGVGSGSVPLFAGTTPLHAALERAIAAFHGVEASVLYPSGYAANSGILPALLGSEDAVVGDLFNHASIQEGCRLSGASNLSYTHGRIGGLERVLRRATRAGRVALVVTDGVFSMEGDVAPLDRIHEVAGRFGAHLVVDEAHAIGVVGPTGRGAAEAHGLQGRIDVTVGSLSKAPGGIGGYAAGSQELVDYLRYYSGPHLFSTSLPPPVAAGLIAAFEIMTTDSSLHARLWSNIRRLSDGLQTLGFRTERAQSAIVPIVIGDEARLKDVMQDLWAEGIFVNGVTFPAVPRNRARLRLTMTSELTPADIDSVLEALARVGRKHGCTDEVGKWAGLTS